MPCSPERDAKGRSEASPRWSGRFGFVLAAIGSAVGLGSIWKFPYEVGANGGGAFIAFYVLGLILVVVPLMLAEFAIGRRGRGDAATSLAGVAAEAGSSRHWGVVGWLGIVAGFLILSFYSVIGGWTLAYAVETLIDGLPAPAEAGTRFESLLAAPARMTAYHAAFMAATAVIVARGVNAGIEAASRVLMPVLAVLMTGLAIHAAIAGDLGAALDFLLAMDTGSFTAHAAIEAIGLGFFSIGVGLGLMVTYAAYAAPDVSLVQVALAASIADTVLSFLAGLAVFPIVFAHGLDPAGGPGLVFVTLPVAFAAMPGGIAVALAFFALLLVAALASAVSLLELVVAPLVPRLGWTRPRAVAVSAAACFAVGLATVFSFNLWAGWSPLGAVPGLEAATVFDLLDDLTSNVMLPLGGLLIALFAGWRAPRLLEGELGLGPTWAGSLRWALRWAAPALILAATLAPVLL
jgi:NSS family neurotransmitter:Na+ symporter